MRLPWLLLCAGWLAFCGALANETSADEGATGEQIYRQQCAKCHGANGEGVLDQYAKPLAGDRPLDDLTNLIVETMPEDDPAACVGRDAEKVAAYVYDSFYSKAAQARRGGPRVELARLTVGQYRNAIADLIAGFSEPGKWDDQRGLNGEYFNSKHFNGDKRVLERRDAVVDFAFGEAGPVPDKIDPEEFTVRWQGSLLAPDSGEYEFTIKTENGARLWLNDSQHPLIDAWVKSGSDVEYRQTIHLQAAAQQPLNHAVPELERGVKDENDDMPRISKMQIELMINSFVADFSRVATLQFTNSVGQARMRWLGVEDGHHDLSHKPDNDEESQKKLVQINRWYCEQLAHLVTRLAETPEPGGGGSLLDNTLVIWTNELGKGNSHTLDDIPFVLVDNGLDFRMGLSIKYPKLPHNRLLLSLAHGFGHRLERFGNPNFCGDGPLPGLT